MQRLFVLLFAGLLVAGPVTFSTVSAADGWGTLTGQFVLDGGKDLYPSYVLKPKVKKGDASARDPQCCAVQDVPNDEVVVNQKNGGIQHVFVYIQSVRKQDVHRTLRRSKQKELVFDQKACIFKQHSLFVRTDQKVRVKSDDNITHNMRTVPIVNQPVNFTVTANDRIGIAMPVPIPEPVPMKVECNVHPWMKAWWLVLDHPYAAITDKDGRFKIEKLPAGEREFIVWQERAGYIQKSLKVKIEDGKTTDLGVVKVDGSMFQIKDEEKPATAAKAGAGRKS